MPYINVNIDFDDIDTYDLIKEIKHRWKWMNKEDKAELINIVRMVGKKPVDEIGVDHLPIVSDENQLKIFEQ